MAKYTVQGYKFDNRFFKRIARVLWLKQRKSDSLVKKSEFLPYLFFKDRQDWLARGRPFVKSVESKSIPSIFKKEQLREERQERFALLA